MSDDNSPDIDEETVDRIGLAAGAELRRPAPASGARAIAATARRRRTTQKAVVGGLAVAAVLGAGTAIVLARRSDDAVHTAPPIPTTPSTLPTTPSTLPTPTAPGSTERTAPQTAALTTAPASTGPADTEAPVSTTTPRGPTWVADVSYLAPPPELAIRRLASIEVPEATLGNYSAAIGDQGIAVSSSLYSGVAPTRIDVVGFDGEARSIEGPSGTDGGSLSVIAYGPGDVVYATRPGDSIEDFAVVAVALSGPNAGGVVALTPQNINRFVEYPPATFGHSEAGIADRRPGGTELTTPTPYVDVEGQPVAMVPELPWFTLDNAELGGSGDGGVIRSSSGFFWELSVEPAPDRAGSYVGNSPPAAGPDGSGVYWTHIGPNAAPHQDFGEPTMWVIAQMRPDGTASWWSLPDGWQVIASDYWGTVLARQDGTELQLALADFSNSPAPQPSTTASNAVEQGVPSYLRAPDEAVVYPDLFTKLAEVATGGRLSPSGDDRLVVFGEIPEQVVPLSIFAASGAREDAAGYVLVVVSDLGDERPEYDGTISLHVSTAEPDRAAKLDATGWEITTVGEHKAWLGPDAGPDCPPALEEGEGLETVIVEWIDNGVSYAVHMSPLPCEQFNPLEVADVLELARELAVCSGWIERDLTCTPYISE